MDRDNTGRRNQSGVGPSVSSQPGNSRGRGGPQMISFSVPTGRPANGPRGQQNATAGRQPAGAGQARKPAPANKKSIGSRVGLRKKGAPQTPPRQGAPSGSRAPGNNGGRRRPVQAAPQVQNPQQAGYRQGTPRPPRRMTQTEKRRMELRRRMLGLAAVLAALAAGIALSVNLLFKVTEFRVENMDRSTPANTSIYSEQQIVDLLGIQKGDNLFGFSTGEKTKALAGQLPYLDAVKVETSLPGTVVVKVQAAKERYYLQLGDGRWLVLSEHLKALKLVDTQPDGLTWLEAQITDNNPQPGSIVTLQVSNTAMEQNTEAEDAQATTESALYDANAALQQLQESMATYGILENVSVISLTDLSELSFLYQGRVSVRLGTVNNLDYKMHLASNALLDADGTGIGATERGTLDVSYQQADGEIRGYFQLAEADSGADAADAAPEEAEGDTADSTTEATE